MLRDGSWLPEGPGYRSKRKALQHPGGQRGSPRAPLPAHRQQICPSSLEPQPSHCPGPGELQGTMGDIVGLCCWSFLNMCCAVRAQSICRVTVEMLLHRPEEAPSHKSLCFNLHFPFPTESCVFSALEASLDKSCNTLMIIICYILPALGLSHGRVAWQLLWAYPTGQQY